MDSLALNIDSESKDQAFIMDIEPNGERITVRVHLKYYDYIAKYMVSIWNASTGEPLVMNVPLVASTGGEIANDLLKQFAYMRIGSMYCATLANEMPRDDPLYETISQYEVVWGDSPWLS